MKEKLFRVVSGHRAMLCSLMVLTLTFAAGRRADACWIAMPLRDVIGQSDLVAAGAIVRGEGTIDRGGRLYKVGIIEVKEIILGDEGADEVRLIWPTGESSDGLRMAISTDISYRIGQDGVWLLRADSENPDLFLADRPDRFQPSGRANEIAVLADARQVAGGRDGTPNPLRGPAHEVLARTNAQFALKLYDLLKEDEGSLFFSPYSISTALAMTYAGARAETARQMAQALRFFQEQSDLHPAFAKLAARMEEIQDAGEVTLSVANSLWPQQDYPFLEEYMALLEEFYGTSVTPVDYRNATEAARLAINAWVEEKTEEKIKDLIAPDVLDPLTRLVLVNAIYFKGDWKIPFDPDQTDEAPFYVSGEETVDVLMMFQTGRFSYAEAGVVKALELPYAGGDISMLILLPREKGRIDMVEDALADRSGWLWLNEVIRAMRAREVEVYLPRFRLEWGVRSLVPELKALGMDDAFGGDADFSGMDGTGNLLISDVLHKAFVEVNEEGTEAAAATAVIMMEMAMPAPPPVFRADHPFLFLIRENSTGSILFMGRMSRPENE